MTALPDHPGLEPLRRVYRSLRSRYAAALHPWRRRSARTRIAALSPRRIIFVCTGNICRSPYAEFAALERLSGASLEIGSAGLLEPGRPSPEAAVEAAAAHGVSLESHRSKRLDGPGAARADLLVVMEALHVRALRERFAVPDSRLLWLGDLDPGRPSIRAIPDPIDKPVETFLEVYARMDRCLDELLSLL